jgi:hypothetical protein
VRARVLLALENGEQIGQVPLIAKQPSVWSGGVSGPAAE